MQVFFFFHLYLSENFDIYQKPTSLTFFLFFAICGADSEYLDIYLIEGYTTVNISKIGNGTLTLDYTRMNCDANTDTANNNYDYNYTNLWEIDPNNLNQCLNSTTCNHRVYLLQCIQQYLLQ